MGNKCPGKSIYIRDLNNTISGINNEIKQLRKQIYDLEKTEQEITARITSHWFRLLYLYFKIYAPLFSEDNKYVVNQPGQMIFSKEVIHKKHEDYKFLLESINNKKINLPSRYENFETLSSPSSFGIFEGFKEEEEEEEEGFEEGMFSRGNKKSKSKPKKKSKSRGDCNKEDREINSKKKQIENLRKTITGLNNEIIWRSDYIIKLQNYEKYILGVIQQIQDKIASIRLTNEKNSRELTKPKYTAQEISDRTMRQSEGFVDKITYGSFSGISSKADAYETLYKEYHNALIQAYRIIDNHLQPSVDYLKKTELTGLDFSFETVKNENALIEKQILDNNTKFATDTKKYHYQSENLVHLKSTNFILFILFYTVFIFLIYFVFVNVSLSFYSKVGIVLIMVLYPFIIKPFEQLIWFILKFIYSLLFGKVYSGRV